MNKRARREIEELRKRLVKHILDIQEMISMLDFINENADDE
jgi:hypothetical protein